MGFSLDGMKLAVLGGDTREIVLTNELISLGAFVNSVGLPYKSQHNISIYNNPIECIKSVEAIILPVPGVDINGKIYCPNNKQPLLFTRELAESITKGTPVFVGSAGNFLKKMTAEYGLNLIELMALDEVAILNSIPTAEGAVQIAMERTSTTIHGSSVFILGFGRTGKTLARLLSAMGARTSVVARRPEHLARVVEMNIRPVHLKNLLNCLGEADIIFNTVPDLILNKESLMRLSPGTLIIDLASSPGGTDFITAKELGIDAVLAPGLPGKVAPLTAGRILANVIIRLIQEIKAI